MSRAVLYFDGACSGNPGPMGAGAVVEMAGKTDAFSRAMGRGTNNEAEYHGLLLALHHAQAAGATDVEVRGDSQLVLRQLDGRYAVRAANLVDLHASARRLLARFASVKLTWIPREKNGAADAAAREAIA